MFQAEATGRGAASFGRAKQNREFAKRVSRHPAHRLVAKIAPAKPGFVASTNRSRAPPRRRSQPQAIMLYFRLMTDKARRLLFLGAVFCGFLALYLFTAQRGVSWQDSGEFQYRVLAGDFTGIFGLALAHPLYIALARLFAAPFSGDAAIFAVTAFSSFTAALALLLLAALVLRLTQNYLAALVSVLTLGFAHMFWTLGCLAEVYTLSLAFLFAELLCLSHILSPD